MLATAHKIYPDEKTANSIRSLYAAKSPQEGWEVAKVSIGYQVKRASDPLYTTAMDVLLADPMADTDHLKAALAKAKSEGVKFNLQQVLKSFAQEQEEMMAAKEKPETFSMKHSPHFVKPKMTIMEGAEKFLKPAVKPTLKASEKQVVVELGYVKQSPQFLEVVHNGKTTWVQKSCVESWDVKYDTKTIFIHMPISYAKKRGFGYAFM